MFSFRLSSSQEPPILWLAPAKIKPNPYQPRKKWDPDGLVRLADSISRHGILQPLCVRRLRGGTYELISGERRLRAAGLIGLEKVPCLVMEGVDERTSAQLSLVENLQREGLNVFEEAQAILLLIQDQGMTREQVGAALSLSLSAISNKLRLLQLSAPQRSLVLDQGLGERHARAVLRIPEESVRTVLLGYMGKAGLSARQADALVEEYLQDPQGVTNRLLEPPTPQESPLPAPRPIHRFVVKDVRIFINSVDKALRLIHESGIPVEADKTEEESYVTYHIKVPKHAS